jgi:hypothetical protein
MKEIVFDTTKPFTRFNLTELIKDACEAGTIKSAEFSMGHLQDVLTFSKEPLPEDNVIFKQAAEALSNFVGDAPVSIGKRTVIYVE